ncbi:MAG: hypothetical protein GXZ19_05600, partial [Bacteroidales bacterium]|nr:hypothetical protein [Bacteroidales bacterium]
MKQLLVTFFLLLSIVPALQSNSSLPIVPKPANENTSGEQVSVEKKWSVFIPSQLNISREYLSSIFKEFGIECTAATDKKSALIVVDDHKKLSKNSEAYRLQIGSKGRITISASSENGVLYAFQSLSQIVMENGNSV